MTRDEERCPLCGDPLRCEMCGELVLTEAAALERERDAARAWARRWKMAAKERLRSQRDSLNDATELLARSTEDRDALQALCDELRAALDGTREACAIEQGRRMHAYDERDALAARVTTLKGALRGLMGATNHDVNWCDRGFREAYAAAEQALAAPAAPGAGEGE